jgi:hypothetical protein
VSVSEQARVQRMMNKMDIEKTFDKYEKEFLKFERVENKFSNRPDLHAFILLDKLFPEITDMISSAEHDQIWLDISMEDFEKIATEKIILELVRCGVMFDEESLSLFV